ncbi:uncharacterized protein SCHCODRAFT_02210276 [Schizophyllum commune H4-8]|uniref:uncharacterized protein n=1 Tax=Schizophyllum commune (strain H4-8 / FGSC 9210) TaxID=578458 RepID=UPI00216109C4|nr:uncharacterized protein SCHCODRAFT_02210276 [Schizophyllum commune H4-8]KAI5894489.1 hypothetical protein SCHCODRAFT_02210276 [Schizophyllum commune H4-8]
MRYLNDLPALNFSHTESNIFLLAAFASSSWSLLMLLAIRLPAIPRARAGRSLRDCDTVSGPFNIVLSKNANTLCPADVVTVGVQPEYGIFIALVDLKLTHSRLQ